MIRKIVSAPEQYAKERRGEKGVGVNSELSVRNQAFLYMWRLHIITVL